MTGRYWCGLAAVLGALSIGCTQQSEVIRGQTPADSIVQAGFDHHAGAHYPGPPQAGPYHAGCAPGAPHGSGWACEHGCNVRRDWYPNHRHWYTYDPPRNLVYPPARTPAALVQYPYYIVKGPDDFFLDESPEPRPHYGF